MSFRTLLGSLLILTLCAGCATSPRRAARRVIPPQRVVLVEFYNRTTYRDVGRHVTNALRQALAEKTEGTDFIVVPLQSLPQLGDPFQGGRISLKALVTAREDYMADALVVGSVERYNPYQDLSVHLNVKLISTGRATVLAQFADTWATDSEATRRGIKEYYECHRTAPQGRFGPDLFLVSPRHFLQFVADHTAEKVLESY